MRFTRALGVGALCALVLAGCHASATVAIRVRADGSGTVAVAVVLDRDARRALAGAVGSPSKVETALPDVPLADLRAHGWTVSSWRATASGGAAITLSKPFTGGAQLAAVLAELDGAKGALRDVRVVRERALLHDRDSVALLADLRHLDVGVAGDPALAARLRAAGVDVAALDQGLQSRLGTSFDLSVLVQLPDGTRTEVALRPGSARHVVVASTNDHVGRSIALLAAAGAALLGLLLFLAAAFNARRR